MKTEEGDTHQLRIVFLVEKDWPGIDEGDKPDFLHDIGNAVCAVALIECYEVEAKFDDSYERQRECIRELSGLLRELQDVLNTKEFASMAASLNPALARSAELQQ